MKAGIYLGKENIEIQELELPEVGDKDVLVKNIYSSICGTDVAVYNHGPNAEAYISAKAFQEKSQNFCSGQNSYRVIKKHPRTASKQGILGCFFVISISEDTLTFELIVDSIGVIADE